MLSSLLHKFVSTKVDGADPTIVRPGNWNAEHDMGVRLTNRTGSTLNAGDVVAISIADDSSVVLDDAVHTRRIYVVALATISNLSVGLFATVGMMVTTKTQGVVTRGNYLRKSATTLRMEDAQAASSSGPAPSDTIALALSASAGGSSTVEALLMEAPTSATPPGMVMARADTAVPPGWLLCNAQAVSRTTYANLFAVIGTTYGAGDGSTTFNVPDMRGRVLVGFDVNQAEFNVMGETGGAKTHTLVTAEMPAHGHPGSTVAISDPGHSHTQKGMSITAASGGCLGVGALDTGSVNDCNNTTTNTTGITASTTIASAGGGGAHNNLQPYMVQVWMIKT